MHRRTDAFDPTETCTVFNANTLEPSFGPIKMLSWYGVGDVGNFHYLIRRHDYVAARRERAAAADHRVFGREFG